MTNLKLHLAGDKKTSTNKSLPICGKESFGIHHDTLSMEDFLKSKIEHRCTNCNNHITK